MRSKSLAKWKDNNVTQIVVLTKQAKTLEEAAKVEAVLQMAKVLTAIEHIATCGQRILFMN